MHSFILASFVLNCLGTVLTLTSIFIKPTVLAVLQLLAGLGWGAWAGWLLWA